VRGLAIALLLVACSKSGLGEACEEDGDCQAGYLCFRSTCTTNKNREELLTKQSGVGSSFGERPAVGGDRVRVRVTQGEGTIFAACDANERLVGGGCAGGYDCEQEQRCRYLRSYPGAFGPDDTLGARWYCTGAAGPMSAYALCQQATSEAKITAPVAADAGVPAITNDAAMPP
jgi:hypothetical protein